VFSTSNTLSYRYDMMISFNWSASSLFFFVGGGRTNFCTFLQYMYQDYTYGKSIDVYASHNIGLYLLKQFSYIFIFTILSKSNFCVEKYFKIVQFVTLAKNCRAKKAKNAKAETKTLKLKFLSIQNSRN
jgi:hypothetical protein